MDEEKFLSDRIIYYSGFAKLGRPAPFFFDLSFSKLAAEFKEVNEKPLGMKLSDVKVEGLIGLLEGHNQQFYLKLSGSDITDMSVLRLQSLLEKSELIKGLDLSNTKLTVNGFRYLAHALLKNKSLESLNLRDTDPDFTTQSKTLILTAASSHPKLHTIDVGFIPAEGFDHLAKNFQFFEKFRSIALSEHPDSLFPCAVKDLLIKVVRERKDRLESLESISVRLVSEDERFEQELASILVQVRQNAAISLDLSLRDRTFNKKPKDLEL